MIKRRRPSRALPFAPALVAAVAALAALAWPAPPALAHKFHTSFAEVSHNTEAGTLEVTLRTFPDDLEAAVRRRASLAPARPPAKDRKKEFEERVAAYVAETFQLKTANGDPVKISWVGMDAGVDSAWLYFEARLPAGIDGLQLRSRFLFDLFDDQINLVNLKSNGQRTALRFERGKADFQSVSLR
jgi:uncharacterized protein DUF6702